MRPQHPHSVIATRTQAKLFANDVCLRAASELAGGNFLTYPLDSVRRTAEITVDDFEQDWTQVGFSAVKMYVRTRERPNSIVYNFWAHSTMPNPEPMIKAYETELRAELAQVIKDHNIDTDTIGNSAIADDELHDGMGEDYDDDGIEHLVVEKLEFSLDSRHRQPFKEHHYEFVEDGMTLGIMNFADPIDSRWLGDSIDEQIQLQRHAREYSGQFDELDMRIMLGILGRIGLLAPSP